MSSAIKTLRGLHTCAEALAWAETHGGSLAEMWRDCPRGDWLLWYAARAGARREDLVRAAAACAELALPYAGDGRGVCEAAIAAARTWADAPAAGAARAAYAAADAAYAAAYTAYAADAAGSAAYAAADAADAAYAAADAARAAADAAARVAARATARAAAYAAAYAAGAARAEMHARCADVVRGCVHFAEVAQ